MSKNKITIRGVPGNELERLLQRLHINIHQCLAEEVEADLLNFGEEDKNFARQVLLTQYGSNKNTVLHAALESGDKKIIDMISEKCFSVLSKLQIKKLLIIKNAQGKTVEQLEDILNMQKVDDIDIVSGDELDTEDKICEEQEQTSTSHPDNRVFLFDEEITAQEGIFSPMSNAGYLSMSSSSIESPYPFSPPAGGKSWVAKVEEERFTRGATMSRAL
jgi:hypothetical protein